MQAMLAAKPIVDTEEVASAIAQHMIDVKASIAGNMLRDLPVSHIGYVAVRVYEKLRSRGHIQNMWVDLLHGVSKDRMVFF